MESHSIRPGGGAEDSQLSIRDLEAFAKLGISPQLLSEAHVRRVSDAEARNDYGIMGAPSMDMRGIIFPYISPVTGYRVTARLRRDNPEIENGKPKNKYISPWGDGRHLYYPPGSKTKLEQPETPIVLVEAEKSALALTAWAERGGMSLLPLGLGGCWGWRGRIGRVENAHGERVDEVGPLRDLSYCDARKVYVLLDANAATNPKVAKARTALIAELRQRGCDVWQCQLPILDGINGPDDYIAACGDLGMANVFSSARDAADQPAQFSDDALALRFSEIHGNDLRYTAARGRWSRFDGTCWKPDESLCVFDLARAVCRTAARAEKPALASRISSAQTVAAVERLARADRCHAATVDQWDADPWLLNTPGGVIDLRTGDLRPAAREDYMTKITATAPGGDCPQWKNFLSEITDGDEGLQGYLQRVSGYALTGVTREHALFFLHGKGGNGKGVFLSTIIGIMGGYARTAPIETFIASTSERHPTDLAGLQGARLVTATETEEGRRWNESKLKLITGETRFRRATCARISSSIGRSSN